MTDSDMDILATMRTDLDGVVYSALRWAIQAVEAGQFCLADEMHQLRYQAQRLRDEIAGLIETELDTYYEGDEEHG